MLTCIETILNFLYILTRVVLVIDPKGLLETMNFLMIMKKKKKKKLRAGEREEEERKI